MAHRFRLHVATFTIFRAMMITDCTTRVVMKSLNLQVAWVHQDLPISIMTSRSAPSEWSDRVLYIHLN